MSRPGLIHFGKLNVVSALVLTALPRRTDRRIRMLS